MNTDYDEFEERLRRHYQATFGPPPDPEQVRKQVTIRLEWIGDHIGDNQAGEMHVSETSEQSTIQRSVVTRDLLRGAFSPGPRRSFVALVATLLVLAMAGTVFGWVALHRGAPSGVRPRHNQTPAYQSQVNYFWYTAQANDTIEGIAAKFHVQIGGIFELNNFLSAGQEITIGMAYKIPEDPNYGKNFRPATYMPSSTGSTTFGSSPWTSMAGAPLPEALCSGANGNGNPLGYDMVSPNPHSFWVRGFRWYHDGVDISTTAGSPIHAAQAGEVIWAGWDVGGLGYSVKINNCWGISTVYGHLESLNVKAGENVLAGETVGLEGSTGWSTGPQLHFMVEVNNIPVDPAAYYGFNCDAVTGSTHYVSGASCD